MTSPQRRAYTSWVNISPVSAGVTSRSDGRPTSRALLVMGQALANLVAVTLRHGSYETKDANGEADAERMVREWKPDIAIIDIDHHFAAVRAVGGGMVEGRMPVLAFTRRRDAALKLRAYEAGADDIIEVPFTLDEIIARPYALMRRSRGVATKLVPKINLGGSLEVDLVEQSVKMNGGRGLDLTPIQQTLLYVLAANTGDVLTRETLLATIWGDFQIESNVVDRHIRELRVKMEDDWRTPRYIETVAGRGYRFRPQLAQGEAVH